MGKLYNFDPSTNTVEGYPTREDFIDKYDTEDTFLFYPIDAIKINSNDIYGIELERFNILVIGTLKNGKKVQVIIKNLPIYLDVACDNNTEKQSIMNNYRRNIIKSEFIHKYPGNCFTEKPKQYLRIYFKNLVGRSTVIKRLKEDNYETASDFKQSDWIYQTAVDYNFTFSDWVQISNYRKIKDSY